MLKQLRETFQARLNLLMFTSPQTLGAPMVEFIESYKYRAITKGSPM